MRKRKAGRRKGCRTKGYYYEKGRGWRASDGNRRVPLLYPNGERIRDEDADPQAVKEAYERWKIAERTARAEAEKADRIDGTATVEKVCDLYLSFVEMTGSRGDPLQPSQHAL